MFNLEQSIAEWRQQMLAAGPKNPTPLNELESHLREDMRAILATTEPGGSGVPTRRLAAGQRRPFADGV